MRCAMSADFYVMWETSPVRLSKPIPPHRIDPDRCNRTAESWRDCSLIEDQPPITRSEAHDGSLGLSPWWMGRHGQAQAQAQDFI